MHQSGRRLPYPRDDWAEERHWNQFILEALDYTRTAVTVFSKDPAIWDDDDSRFYLAMKQALDNE